MGRSNLTWNGGSGETVKRVRVWKGSSGWVVIHSKNRWVVWAGGLCGQGGWMGDNHQLELCSSG